MEQQNQVKVQQSNPSSKLTYLNILSNLLIENTNHQQIKQKIKQKIQNVQTLHYEGLVSSQEKYLQKFGLIHHQEDIFLYIGNLITQRNQNFMTEIQNGQQKIKSNIKPPPQPQPQPPAEIIQEVQYVLNNIDLPLSLFKRNDNYWSIDNPKTIQANQYLKQIHNQDRKFKQQIDKKKQLVFKEKLDIRNKTIDVVKQQQQNYKKQLHDKINKKIDDLKKNSEQRKKSITQSLEFIKERGKPLFKKIQKQFQQKVQIPSLQQKKRKLSEIRQVMRSVPLQQIESHKQKYQKLKMQHQSKTILNQPLNISFKSHFYQQIKSINSSRYNQINSNLSLYQKRIEYGKIVKQNHKPPIDQTKKEQMQNRIKLMNKRRARVKRNKKPTKNSDDEDQDQQEPEQQSEQEQQPQPQQNSDEEDSDRPRSQKDDQYQPTNKQRYKMGINYLKVARKLAAKKQASQTNNQTSTSKVKIKSLTQRANSALQNKTIDFNTYTSNDQGLQTVDPTTQKKQKFIWVSKYDQQVKKQQRIKYKNYLRQLNTNQDKTLNLMDTSQINKQIQISSSRVQSHSRSQTRRAPDIQAQIMYHTNLQNKIRNIQERARNQEQLLKFKRINKTQKINKQMVIDNAVVDTIKARLAMMNNKSVQK